ncbi:collagen alpha-3(VI) chain-like [Branchiostoma lanceolatum]|uniref:collagen alpha-3(VI) chain-like n=1 Tax=Branchiostoma lanceolatum TaxID=7740 RepID=UPI003454649D
MYERCAAPVCSVRVDLVFVLDGTGSVGAENFGRMKTFVQKMISDFDIGREATRIGVVVYSSRAELVISLDAFDDQGSLEDAVADIAYPGGYTRTGAAIDYTTKFAFSTRNGAREGVKRVAIILTDGISYDDPSEPAQSMRQAAIITYAVGIGSNLDSNQLDVIAGVPENLVVLDDFSKLDNLRTILPNQVCDAATSEQILIRIVITSRRFDVSLLNGNSTAFQSVFYQINRAFVGYFPGVPGFSAPLVSLAPGPADGSVVAICLGSVPAFASTTVRTGLMNAPAQLNNLTIDTALTSVVAARTSVIFVRLSVNVTYTVEYQVRGSGAYNDLIPQLRYQVLNQFSVSAGTVDIVSLRVTQILPGSTAATTTVDVEVVTTTSEVSNVQTSLTNITAAGRTLGGASIITSQVALSAPVCSVRVDLVFVLDGTGSVGAENFGRMKTFVQKMISDFDIGREATRIGVVVYSSRAELVISLDAFDDQGSLEDAVADIAYPGGYTRTGAAIDYTTKFAFSTRNGAREGVKRVAIILTDGISYDDPSEPAQSMRQAAIITYAVGIGSNLDSNQLDVIAGVPENLVVLDDFSKLDNLRTILPNQVCDAATSEQILIRIVITSRRFDVSLLNGNSTAFQSVFYQINRAFVGYFPGVPGFSAPLVSLAPRPADGSVVAICLGSVPAFASTTVRTGLMNAPAQLNNLTIDTALTSVVAARTSVIFVRLSVNVTYTVEYQVRGSDAYNDLIPQLRYQVLNQFSVSAGTVDIVSLRVTQILPGSTAATTTVDVEVVTTTSEVSNVQTSLTNITAAGRTLGGASIITSQVALSAPVCSVRVDLVFVLDGTGSVGAENFGRMKTFVQKMISDFDIGREATRIGVVVYSSRAELVISLDAFDDQGSLEDAVADIAYPGGYTRTGAAIDYTTKFAFSTRNGAREGVKRVAIILTDGISYDDPSEPAQSMRQAAIITYAVGIGSNLDSNQLDVIAGVPENLVVLDDFSKLDNLRTILPNQVCDAATSEQILIRIVITSRRFDVSLLNGNSTAFQSVFYQINRAFVGYFPGVPGFSAPLVSLAPGPADGSVVAICLGSVPAFASTTVRTGLMNAPAQLNNLTIDTALTSVVAARTSVIFVRLSVNVTYTVEYQVRGSDAYNDLIPQLRYQVLNQFSVSAGTVDIVSLRVTQILPGSTAATTTVDVEVVTTTSEVSNVQTSLTNITAAGRTLGGASIITSQVALSAPVCSVRVDLVFVLDGTGIVGAENFGRMKTFVQKMISDFDIGREATRIGVVVYSSRAELVISLDAFDDQGSLEDAVADIAYPGGYTRTGAAIDYTTKFAFSTRNGAREGVKRVAIILTDGISYDDPSEPAQSMRQAAIITYAVGIGSNLDSNQLDVIAGVPENLVVLDDFSKLDNLRTILPNQVCDAATSEQILIRIVITSRRFDVSLLNGNSTAFQSVFYQINRAFVGYFPGVPGFSAPLVSLAPGPADGSVVAICLGSVPAFASTTVRTGLMNAPAQLNNLTIDTALTSVVAARTSVIFVRLSVNVTYTVEYQVRGSGAYNDLIPQLRYQVLNQFSVSAGTVDIVSLRVTQILPGSTAATTTVDVEVVTTTSEVSNVQTSLTNITAAGRTLGGASIITSQVALSAPVCSVRVDLVFVLDGTGSVGAENFGRMKTFVQKMISDFDIGREATRIGVVVYSSRAELVISLDAFDDQGSLEDAVADIAYPGGYTRTGAAIDYTTKFAFSTRNGAREGVKRVAIILTDGISYDDPSEPAQSMHQAAIITYAVGIGSNLDSNQLDVIAGVPENLVVLDDFSKLDNLRTILPNQVCDAATSEQILIRIVITSRRFDVSLLNGNSTAFQSVFYQINRAFVGYFPGVPGFSAPLVSLAPGPADGSVVAICLGSVPAFASTTVRTGLMNAPAQLNNLTIDTALTSVVAARTSVIFVRLSVNVTYTVEYQVRGSDAYNDLIPQLRYQVLNQFSVSAGTVDIVSLRVTQILPGSTAATTTVDVEVVTTTSEVSNVQTSLTNITAAGRTLGGASIITSQVALSAPVCSVRVDLVFVLDGTGSVGAENFGRMKTFVQKMISDFDIGREATRIGVVVYSSRAELAISLDAFDDQGSLEDAVADIAYPGGYTRTGAAIDYTTKFAFSTRNGAREGVKRVAIILTDGISYDDPSEPAQSMRQAAIITYAVGIGSNLDSNQLDVIAGVPENLVVLDDFSKLDNLRTILPNQVCDAATSEQILIRIVITSRRFDVSLLNGNSTAFQSVFYQINRAFVGYFPGVPGFSAPLVSLAPGPADGSVVAICLGSVPAFASTTVRTGLMNAPAQLNNLTIDTALTSVVAARTSVIFVRLSVNVTYTVEYQVRGSGAYNDLIPQLRYQVLNQFSVSAGTVDIVSLRVTQILPGSTAATTTVDVEVVTTTSEVSNVQTSLTNITAAGRTLGGASIITSQVALSAPVCSVRVDLVFVLDGTGSVGAENFGRMKTFVQKMISDFDIGREATRIGVVVYSSRAELVISLDAFDDQGSLEDAVADIAYPGGYTRTGAAIDYTTKFAFSTRNGAREGVKRVAIILTDGISYDDPSEPAQSMRKAAIITYGVGIGSNLDRDQLDVIAGVPENLVVLDDFSKLDNLRTILPNQICDG